MVSIRPYRTTENVIDGVVITFEDVTDRKRTDDAIRESEQRFRTLFELSNDSVVLIDAETLRFVEANQLAHNSLGYTHEEFLQLTVFDIEAKQDEEEIKRVVAKLINDESQAFVTSHWTKTKKSAKQRCEFAQSNFRISSIS